MAFDPQPVARRSRAGNAFAATADDPSAIYYNPAGITQIPGDRLPGGRFELSRAQHAVQPDAGRSIHAHAVRGDSGAADLFHKSLENTPLSLAWACMRVRPGREMAGPNHANIRDYALESKLTFITVSPVLATKSCHHSRSRRGRRLIMRN